MSFVSATLAALRAKGLTRKQAKKVFNAHHNFGPGRYAATAGASRQVIRQMERLGGNTPRPSYSNAWKVFNHKRGHRINIPRPNALFMF